MRGGATQDKIFILSYEDVTNTNYGFEAGVKDSLTRCSFLTDYAKQRANNSSCASGYGIPYGNNATDSFYWLRNPGHANRCACTVKPYGSGEGQMNKYNDQYFGVFDDRVGVRPALYLEAKNVEYIDYERYPSLSEESAALFIGFLTNNSKLTESEINNSVWYQLMTNTYKGPDKELQARALISHAIAVTDIMAEESIDNSAYLNKELIKYLEKELGRHSELDEEIINEYQNFALKKLTEAMQDAINNWLPTSAESIFDVTDMYNAYSTVTGTIEKGKVLGERITAGVEACLLLWEAEKAGRYTYFSSYLANRGSYKSSDDEIFKAVMTLERGVITNNNEFASFIDCFTWITGKDSFINHFDLIDEWAEYIYSLSCFVNQADCETKATIADEGSITYTVSNTSASITAFDSNVGGCIILPDKLNGQPVVSIKEDAFRGCTLLESVKLGNTVEKVGSNAFKGCASLQSVIIPSTVTEIGEAAFEDCTSLQKIVMPNSIISIGENALNNCHDSLNIVCGCRNTYIIEYCENNNLNYTLVHNFYNYISDENATCKVKGTITSKCANCEATDTIIDSFGVLDEHSDWTYTAGNKNENSNVIIAICGICSETATVTLSAPVEQTYDGSVKCATVVYSLKGGLPAPDIDYKGANLMDGKTVNVGDYTASIKLGDVIAEVEFEIKQATPYIAEAPSATSVSYGDTLSSSALTGGIVLYGNGAGAVGEGELSQKLVDGNFFWKDETIKPAVADSNTTPYSVVFIPNDTVNYNTVEFTLPLTVGKAAAPFVQPAKTMTVSYHTKTVGAVTLPTGWTWQESYKNTALTAGTPVTAKAVYTAADKDNFETTEATVTITRAACGHVWNSGVITTKPTATKTGIKTYTCTDCGATREETVAALGAPKKGTTLKDSKNKAYYKVTKAGLKNGTVEYVKPVNKKAATVSIPATIKADGITYKVTSIAKNAFKSNKKVTKVTIGSNVKTISANAFYGCTKLKTLTIGKNVTTIGDKAFYKCTALTKVTIPSKVTKIGKSAFYGCKKLKTVTIKTTKLNNSRVGSNAFKGIYSKAVIKVPKAKVKAYTTLLKKKGIAKTVTVKKY